MSNHLGRFLASCRARLQHTSREVATISKHHQRLTNLSHSNLLAMEHGKHIPTLDKILTLSEIYHVPLELFVTELQRDMAIRDSFDEEGTLDQLIAEATTAAGQTDWPRALTLASAAHRVAEDENRPAESVRARTMIARAQAKLGSFRVAQVELESILVMPGLSADTMARVTDLLIDIHRNTANFHLAGILARANLDFIRREKLVTHEAACLTAIAEVLRARGETKGAVRYYREALNAVARSDDQAELARAGHRLGLAYAATGQNHLAIKNLEIAAESQATTNAERAATLVALARIHDNAGAYRASQTSAAEAKEIAQADGLEDTLFSSLYYLWKSAKAEKQLALGRAYEARLAALWSELRNTTVETAAWFTRQ